MGLSGGLTSIFCAFRLVYFLLAFTDGMAAASTVSSTISPFSSFLFFLFFLSFFASLASRSSLRRLRLGAPVNRMACCWLCARSFLSDTRMSSVVSARGMPYWSISCSVNWLPWPSLLSRKKGSHILETCATIWSIFIWATI